MTKIKKIPCRVCGKLFKPCGYCQSHADTFKWRNFACSRECATKYISDTIVYRNSFGQSKNNDDNINNGSITHITNEENTVTDIIEDTISKKKSNKRKQINNIETINEESEQID